MKANFIKTGLLIALSVIIFSSCQKASLTDLAPAPEQKKMSMKELVSNPQFAKAYHEKEEKFNKFKEQNPSLGAEFIVPIFTQDGFGIGQNMVTEEWCDPLDPSFYFYQIVSGQMAFFGTEIGPKKNFRRNTDGTVTVHINSKKANASHLDVAPNIELTGTNTHLNMSYTRSVITFNIYDENNNIIFTFYFIDWFSSHCGALSFQGNGKVRLGNTGPLRNLISRWVISAGGNHETAFFTLN